MTDQELNELRSLVKAETTMPWTVKPLLGQFVIKGKDGQTVQATAARCRLIELALRTLVEPMRLEHRKVENVEREENTSQRRSYEDRSDFGFTSHTYSDADRARSDEL